MRHDEKKIGMIFDEPSPPVTSFGLQPRPCRLPRSGAAFPNRRSTSWPLATPAARLTSLPAACRKSSPSDGTSVVVENKPGASKILAQIVARIRRMDTAGIPLPASPPTSCLFKSSRSIRDGLRTVVCPTACRCLLAVHPRSRPRRGRAIPGSGEPRKGRFASSGKGPRGDGGRTFKRQGQDETSCCAYAAARRRSQDLLGGRTSMISTPSRDSAACDSGGVRGIACRRRRAPSQPDSDHFRCRPSGYREPLGADPRAAGSQKPSFELNARSTRPLESRTCAAKCSLKHIDSSAAPGRFADYIRASRKMGQDHAGSPGING